jgi:hypothetical protein
MLWLQQAWSAAPEIDGLGGEGPFLSEEMKTKRVEIPHLDLGLFHAGSEITVSAFLRAKWP